MPPSITQPWEPEHGVDAGLARRLVAACMPSLAGGEPRHVGSGWDVDVWRFGDVAVRFPRRAMGVRCLENELCVLPAIAGHVPLPVPRPIAIGQPSPTLGFPARFYAHPYLPGTPAIRARLDDAALARLAAPLGAFLRALHALPPPPALRDDDRGDVARVAERGRAWLDRVALDGAAGARAAALLAAADVPPTDVAPALCHADFHAGNLLVDDGGAPAAVIDWGDCSAGDPAIDLAIGWSLVPPAARAAFLRAYGDVTPATWARARVGALSRQGLALLAWGQDTGDVVVAAWACASIARVLDD
jgi:aminoglycoside phosphotransferase (APT) family kinase protein